MKWDKSEANYIHCCNSSWGPLLETEHPRAWVPNDPLNYSATWVVLISPKKNRHPKHTPGTYPRPSTNSLYNGIPFIWGVLEKCYRDIWSRYFVINPYHLFFLFYALDLTQWNHFWLYQYLPEQKLAPRPDPRYLTAFVEETQKCISWALNRLDVGKLGIFTPKQNGGEQICSFWAMTTTVYFGKWVLSP